MGFDVTPAVSFTRWLCPALVRVPDCSRLGFRNWRKRAKQITRQISRRSHCCILSIGRIALSVGLDLMQPPSEPIVEASSRPEEKTSQEGGEERSRSQMTEKKRRWRRWKGSGPFMSEEQQDRANPDLVRLSRKRHRTSEITDTDGGAIAQTTNHRAWWSGLHVGVAMTGTTAGAASNKSKKVNRRRRRSKPEVGPSREGEAREERRGRRWRTKKKRRWREMERSSSLYSSQAARKTPSPIWRG